jgi:hypothetical protein
MSKAKVGVSMLYCLGESFNHMVKRLGTMDTKYIEILDDGTHDLNKQRVTSSKKPQDHTTLHIPCMHPSQTSTYPRQLSLC